MPLFDPSPAPRFYGCAPGVDFPMALVEGLINRARNAPPELLANTEIIVNTQRMQRRIHDLFTDRGPLLLPRIRVISNLPGSFYQPGDTRPVSGLRRRLELARLIAALLEKEPGLAPAESLFDLADSLSQLLREMYDEDVSATALQEMDVSGLSEHWERSLKFLNIVSGFLGNQNDFPPDTSAILRQTIAGMIRQWEACPPANPVIVAGSTGSRGPTALLMQAVARLDQGAVVFPGFDFDMSPEAWSRLDSAFTAEDHPQFRFRNVLQEAGLSPESVRSWLPDKPAPNPARNKLVSLALRPAPVTYQWMEEGPRLTGLKEATADISLIEAPSERAEARAIAFLLRRAAEEGKTTALITPDKILTRRVASALGRWRIEPDTSAGDALDLTAPGRLFRQVAAFFKAPIRTDALISVLKHPLVCLRGFDRNQHMLNTRALELWFRNNPLLHPEAETLRNWASKKAAAPGLAEWVEEITPLFDLHVSRKKLALNIYVETHLEAAVQIAGPGLWEEEPGRKLRQIMDDLIREAPNGGDLLPHEYTALFDSLLRREEARNPVRPHPGILIWGTLESRVQGADTVILGGLNEGTWPSPPSADPWLNREMRHQAGLLLPERKIGLSAHDFQQAIGAKTVILSRAVRTDETETVPSRWLNRLTNLLQGVSNESRSLLEAMRERGRHILELSAKLEHARAVPPEPRPAPCPPVTSRPNRLAATRITVLIRDPYAIYARYILGLRPLRPLLPEPDALLRGIQLHDVMRKFVEETRTHLPDHETARAILMDVARRSLEESVPWPAARTLWLARLENIADTFLKDEKSRRLRGTPLGLEAQGSLHLAKLGFTLEARADRIDADQAGGYHLYDYKTGQIPSPTQIKQFDKQLLLEALILQAGGFENIPAGPVREVYHIGIGSNPKEQPFDLSADSLAETKHGLEALIGQFNKREQGYISRRAMEKTAFAGDYDHLARFGEWTLSDRARPYKESHDDG